MSYLPFVLGGIVLFLAGCKLGYVLAQRDRRSPDEKIADYERRIARFDASMRGGETVSTSRGTTNASSSAEPVGLNGIDQLTKIVKGTAVVSTEEKKPWVPDAAAAAAEEKGDRRSTRPYVCDCGTPSDN